MKTAKNKDDMTIHEAKSIIAKWDRKNKIIDAIIIIVRVMCIVGLTIVYYH